MTILVRALRALVGATAVSYALALLVHLLLRWTVAPGTLWWVDFTANFTPYLFAPLLILLPLALLARLNWRVVVLPLLVLLVTGALLYAPRFFPPTATVSATGPTIDVLTFNMRGRDKRFEFDAEIAWLDAVAVDIALIQEIPRLWHERAPLDLNDDYPEQYHQSAEVRVRGQSTLTRYPMFDAEPFTLTPTTGAQLRSVVVIDGREVALYNIHLALPVGDETHLPITLPNDTLNLMTRYDETGRNRQITALLDRLDAEPLPYIVAGDFNTSDNAIMYGALAAQMTDAWAVGGTGFGGSWPIASRIGVPAIVPPLLRIDYIWHSAHFRTVRTWQGEPVNSYGDHLPLFATLELLP